jgi:alcohol dehydrogenase
LKKTAQAAVFHAPDTPLELREFPLPAPRVSEVLVEVIACTLCGSDLHSLHGRRNVPTPTVLGHEILGRVAAFGPLAPRRDAAGQPLEVGSRVTWSIVANCGDCFYCRRGLPQKCQRQTKYGHEPLCPGGELTGGLADHCLLAPGTAIFRVPDEISDATVCPANCATATIAAAIDAAGELKDRSVLIMGAGMLGVTATAWARSAGAEHVITCDLSPERLSLASAFGATHTCSPDAAASVVEAQTAGYGVDVAVELTGSPEAFEALLPLIRLGGRAIVIGSVFPSRPVPLLLEQLVRRCLTLRGIHNYAPQHLRAAIEFLASSREYPFETLVAEWHPLAAINDVVASSQTSRALRVGIRPTV